MNLIELRDFTVGYGNRRLVADANATFAPGTLTSLIGRNGSGKSTLLRAIGVLETLVDVDGSRERPVSDIHFEGVSFEYASWLRPWLEGHITLQGSFRLLAA